MIPRSERNILLIDFGISKKDKGLHNMKDDLLYTGYMLIGLNRGSIYFTNENILCKFTEICKNISRQEKNVDYGKLCDIIN